MPKSQPILGYTAFFGEEPPTNRILLLNGLCKNVILGEIARLKYSLKPKDKKYHDKAKKTQIKEFFYFCGSNKKLFGKYFSAVSHLFKDDKNYPLIFTRQMCLFAMEEIINSSLLAIDGFTMRHSWESLLRYLLAVNNEITKLSGIPRNGESPVDEKQVFNLETLTPQIIPLHELDIDVDPIYITYRGHSLLSYLLKDELLSEHLKEYLNDEYQIPFDRFIYDILSMYITNNPFGANDVTNDFTGEKIDATFLYSVKTENALLFNQLSRYIKNNHPERLITTRKFPFYKESEKYFVLVDNMLLLDKCYGQFINDFWFDKAKLLRGSDGRELITIDSYRSKIGYFIEHYTEEIFRHCFDGEKHYSLKMFNELQVKRGKLSIELSDIYLRYNSKIFLAQVKSTGLYDKEKYAGDIDKMYRNDRDGFFASFGINQLAESFKNLESCINQLDSKFPIGKPYKIYPAIIVNEKAMQTPFMAQIFNQRFNELIAISKLSKAQIFPLALIHISDLEQMEDRVHKKPQLFWDILDYNKRNPQFIPPFYTTLNNLDIQPSYKKIIPVYEGLINKYKTKSPADSN